MCNCFCVCFRISTPQAQYLGAAPAPLPPDPVGTDEALYFKLRSFCVTCEWAFPAELFEHPECKTHGEELAALPVGSPSWIAKLEAYISTSVVQDARVQFMAFVDLRAKELEATELSWSIEYSQASDVAGRFHAHAVFSVVQRGGRGRAAHVRGQESAVELPGQHAVRERAAPRRPGVPSGPSSALLRTCRPGRLVPW